MKNVFLYMIKLIAALYFIVFLVAAIDITLAMYYCERQSLLGFDVHVLSLVASIVVVMGTALIITVKAKEPTN